MAEGRQTAEQAAQSPEQTEQKQVTSLSVPQAILLSISMLTELAWQKMGLHIDPVTKQIEPDLKQAQLAIDTISVLTEMIRDWVSERDYDSLRTMLVNLRLNFAEQAKKQQAQGA